jgi:acyl dehydratase
MPGPALGTYLRAAGTAPLPRPSSLPGDEVAVDVVVDADRLAAFQQVCGPYVGAPVPATFVHVLAFAPALGLMASRRFPLPLPGMVHVRQRLAQHRPVEVGERLGLRVRAEGLRPHRRGRLVDLVAEATADGEQVWVGRSTYLSRGPAGGGTDGGTDEAPEPTPPADAAVRRTWRVDARTGRRYAAVSGDVNPIHVSALAARAFGFPRAIAHGMWTASRCLAVLQRDLSPAYALDVAFRSPVLLPSTVRFAAGGRAGGRSFAVTSGSERVHLVGRVDSVG